MRFAYIDSQGKEVGIPSVEALQLRIELGAIAESTMFFDANADRWAPAVEHEIFRTLQREIAEKEGGEFVAPPPPTLAPPEVEEPAAPAPPPTEPTAPPAPVTGPGAEQGEDILAGLTLSGPGEGVADEESGVIDPAHSLEGQLDDLGFDFTTVVEGEEEEEEPPAPAETGTPFDFGDFGALEVEGGEPEEPPAPDTGGMELESRLSEQEFGAGSGVAEGGMELERPMSEYTPERPPSWMDEEEREPPPRSAPPPPPPPPPAEAGGSDSYLHLAAAGREREESERKAKAREVAAQKGTDTPRAKPAPPPPEEKSSSMGLIAVVGVLVLVAGGGWLGWSMFHGAGEAPTEETRTYEQVDIPPLPAEMEPTFRSLAASAQQDLGARIAASAVEAGLPDQPDPDWLGGVYLASASQYAQVAEYWNAMNAWLEDVRGREEQLFREAFEARMDSASVAEADRQVLVERASAGFRSALRERDPVYDDFAAVAQASLGLHDFLLANEESIEYEPAAGGISRDPVLEAVPATKALGDEMWERVDRITDALEGMDALTDRVTTGRLIALTAERLGRTAIH